MNDREQLPKAYNPADYEDGIYAAWEKSGAFRPASDRDPKLHKERKPYTIVMPPPNATGRLHTGHAIMVALEDALIRYHRMKGFDTLYLPGTDHAAIATASVVDRELLAKGIDKHKLGRKEFAKQAKKWADEHRQIIETQVKALGASADWSRNAFTMDKPREEAVKEAFVRLYKKGLIYRDDYMVNWCPTCRTVLADDEVEHHEQEGVLYYMTYGPFTLATTRPETKVGDTAVAVHPDDKRYRKYVGQKVEIQTINGPRKLQVIADEMVDPEFGTGVVKVTPFHDPNDYQVYLRHPKAAGPPLEVIGEAGQMTKAAGRELAGLDRFKARQVMVKWLKQNKLLIKEEVIRHSVGRCYRSDDVIEPRISKQWFIKVSDIAKQAVKFVDDKELKFVPKRFEKTYRDWLEHLHDWCISRQIWFGHPLPAFLNDKGEVSLTKKPGFKPSEDTLDTWFSSALWPISTMGWPKETADLKRFFPGDVLETGYDIIFFWITRMVLMTIALDVKAAGGKLRPPFHTAYLHGLVKDERGRKFSKSLGNGIDPLELIGKYGADALRFMLATSNTPGNDIKYNEERVIGARNFANKLWNISRFIIDQSSPSANLAKLDSKNLTMLDRAILHKLRETAQAVDSAFYDEAAYGKPEKLPAANPPPKRPRPYDLAFAGNALQGFLWSDFADWYLEGAKAQLKDKSRSGNTKIILRFVLETSLKLLHPFMPFITETIWQRGLAKTSPLITADWPELHEDLNQPEDSERFDELKDIVNAIRRARADHHVPAKNTVNMVIQTNEPGWIEENTKVIETLSRTQLKETTSKPVKVPDSIHLSPTADITVLLPRTDLVDDGAELKRLQQAIEQAKMEVDRLSKRLASKDYATKAPQPIVAQTKANLAEAKSRLKKLEAQAKG